MRNPFRLGLAALAILHFSLAGPAPAQPRPEVTQIVDKVTRQELESLMDALTGAKAVTVNGNPYTMESRASEDDAAMEAATRYVSERFAAMGLAPTLPAWKFTNRSGVEVRGRNVVAEISGKTLPSEVYVICAHLDSVPMTGSVSPGADDDASGSAAVLLAAKVLVSSRFDRTIRFVLFTGEEQGIYGSRAYVKTIQDQAAQGIKVKGILNLDMIGFGSSVAAPRANVDVLTRASGVEGRAEDVRIGDAFVAAVDNYVKGTLRPEVGPWGQEDNDSYSFWQSTAPIIPSVLAIEVGKNGNMHTPSDTARTLDFTFFTNFAKAAVATLAELAVVSTSPEPDPGPVESVTRFLPVVLDVAGTAHYTAEAFLANRGTTDASVELSFTASSSFGGAGSGRVQVDLPAGRQVVVDNVVSFLRARGLAIPPGNQAGTVLASFSGLSSASAAVALVRVTAPSEKGRAGVAFVAPRVEDLPTGRTWLYGLRRTERDRTHVALSNASQASPITLRVELTPGAGGAAAALPEVRLGPGQYVQLDDVFRGLPFDEGYASVRVVSGPGPYMAYAVVNDNGTNDGSFVAFETEAQPETPRLLPVVVEAGPWASELVLANGSTEARTVELTYVESMAPQDGAGGVALAPLGPGEQRIVPGALAFLRDHAVGSIGDPRKGGHAGTLTARFLSGAGTATPGFVGARTASPARTITGRYGVFYPGVASTTAATTEAWVFGLRQDVDTRANLAVAAPSDATGPVTVGLEVYDGDTGRRAGVAEDVTLAPGGWKQVGGLLSRFGVQQGYVRVVRRSASGRFVAYGVVNDGATAGSATGTDDGTYIPFTNR